MDNFYNSPLLARTLKTQKTDVMGTIRLNREFVPDSLRSKNKSNMRTGEVAFSQTRDLTISAWKDANVVTLISTYHPVEVSGKEKYGYSKYKPKVVLDYNLSMGGVDKKDQLLQAFPIERVRNINWYKKLFRRLLNVSIHNAFVMFPKPSLMAQRQFRVLLADEIIQRFRPPKVQQPLPTRHFPTKTNKRKSRCKWCRLKNKDSCTSFKCCTCDVNLCIIGCFEDYHVAQGITEWYSWIQKPTPFKDALFWAETPNSTTKTKIKLTCVITSDRWQIFAQSKLEAKVKKEENKVRSQEKKMSLELLTRNIRRKQ